MTKLSPEWVRTSDPVISSPARYRWVLNITHLNNLPTKSHTFWPLTPHMQILTPYHKSNKWRFGWLSHVIQGYQTGILHHRSAREKVTTMHLSRHSWCCYCSARPTLCSSYETELHSLHRQPGRCHWILNLSAQWWMVMKVVQVLKERNVISLCGD